MVGMGQLLPHPAARGTADRGPADRVAVLCSAFATPGQIRAVVEQTGSSHPPIVVRAGARTDGGARQYVVEAHRDADDVDAAFAAAEEESGPIDEVHVVGPAYVAAGIVRRMETLGSNLRRVFVHASAADDRDVPTLDRLVQQAMAEEVAAALAGGPVVPTLISAGPDVAVTAVIPVFDDVRFLDAALDSLATSGRTALDVVIVDDGSGAAVTEALDEIADRARGFRRVTVLQRPHRGLSAARNAGLHAALTDLVLLLDADDLVPEGFVDDAVGVLARRPDLAWVGGRVQNFGNLDHLLVPYGWVGPASLVVNTFPRATALFRRHAILEVGGYDESLGALEDWELYVRLHLAGHLGTVIPRTGQLYRRHPTSMTFSMSGDQRMRNAASIFDRHAPSLPSAALFTLSRLLIEFWKQGYEPSRSVAYLLKRENVGDEGGDPRP